jgi:hypothetical protein
VPCQKGQAQASPWTPPLERPLSFCYISYCSRKFYALTRLPQLKCTGQKTGCDRCKATFNACSYSEAADGRERRRRQASIPKNQKTTESNISAEKAAPQAVPLELQSTNSLNKDSDTLGNDGEDASDLHMLDSLPSPSALFGDGSLTWPQMLQDVFPEDGGMQSAEQFSTLPDMEWRTNEDAGNPITSDPNVTDAHEYFNLEDQRIFLPASLIFKMHKLIHS